MENCIFCKIASGEIPKEKIFEDESLMAFADIHPKAPGHTLVVPKEHYRWFQEMPEELSDRIFRAARKLAQQLKDEYQADFVKLHIDGVDVPHVHVHLIPQKKS